MKAFVIVETDFEHDGKRWRVKGRVLPQQSWCGTFGASEEIKIDEVISIRTGFVTEPIEGGGLHRAASAAIRKAARKDS